MKTIDTWVSLGGEIYAARIDPTNRYRGTVAPLFTLDTVRKLAADLLQDTDRPGNRNGDTIHVIEGGVNDDGTQKAVIAHIQWMYLDEGATSTSFLHANEDGLFPVGDWDWSWHQVEDGPMAIAHRAADLARTRVLREGARQAADMLHQLAPEATGAGFVMHDGHPRLINVVSKERVLWTDEEGDEGIFDCERLGGADEALYQSLQYGKSPEALQAAGWQVLKNDQGIEAYAITFPPRA
ncbi:hypothetical protein ABZ604_31525 [Streptomyces sp. NPDC012473]|uniref:hypothetical protein n=1 Tax=Streptomyces sp. NPDC012473 TaxID=3156676 RepID=UPI0033E47555